MKNETQKMVIAAMFAAVICVVTMVIKIPLPAKGYLNLGDSIVLLAGWMLSPGYGFIAAGIGAVLADVFSGYMIYAPATFVIKGLMAVAAHYGFVVLREKTGFEFSRIISGVMAEVIMVAGYFLLEACLYGISVSLLNVPFNMMQGVCGLILGIMLAKMFEKGIGNIFI